MAHPYKNQAKSDRERGRERYKAGGGPVLVTPFSGAKEYEPTTGGNVYAERAKEWVDRNRGSDPRTPGAVSLADQAGIHDIGRKFPSEKPSSNEDYSSAAKSSNRAEAKKKADARAKSRAKAKELEPGDIGDGRRYRPDPTHTASKDSDVRQAKRGGRA